MFSFLEINTDFSSDSDVSEMSSPKINRLLRIDTDLSMRSNTPSPPPIERRRSPLRRIKSMPVCGFSPRPERVLKLIQTPTRFIKNIKLKLKIEQEIREKINELILNIEEKNELVQQFEKKVHASSEKLKIRHLYPI